MRRLISFLVGASMLGIVIYLGIRSSAEPNFVVWFGLSCALVAPVGLGLVGYAFLGSGREALVRLSQVSAMDQVMAKAETEQERLQLLRQEREDLDALVRYEVERKALETQKEMLETTARKILAELEVVDEHFSALKVPIKEGVAQQELERLRSRVEASLAGDIIFRIADQQFILQKSYFYALPFYGSFFFEVFKSISELSNWIDRMTRNWMRKKGMDVSSPELEQAAGDENATDKQRDSST